MMSKTKKYSLAYRAKKCMKAWSPEKDLRVAVPGYVQKGEHTQIDFNGTPLEFATALYLERFKRGTPWSGFFPPPPRAAAQTPSPETVRPQRLPPVLPKSSEVDVDGRTPLWLAATVIKVSGSGHPLKLIARRSDDQAISNCRSTGATSPGVCRLAP
ncbi:MAG TPA: hypothetical protein VLG46_06805 [Anaerolineae bacterium]|nr:hypothetical protein [Anaerolineae bacterium]